MRFAFLYLGLGLSHALLWTPPAWSDDVVAVQPLGSRSPKGICQILSKHPITGQTLYGSGALLGDRIVTANHVLESGYVIQKIVCSGGVEIPTTHLKFRRFEENDVALIGLPDHYATDIRLVRADEADLGGPFEVWGYGKLKPNTEPATLQGAQIDRFLPVGWGDQAVFQSEKVFMVPGDSGGPLLKRVGEEWALLSVTSTGVYRIEPGKPGLSTFSRLPPLLSRIEAASEQMRAEFSKELGVPLRLPAACVAGAIRRQAG
ncbi:MAG: trypsin-like serine protease [Bacteriovoracia bacterium]